MWRDGWKNRAWLIAVSPGFLAFLLVISTQHLLWERWLVPVLPERRITRSFWLVTHKDTHNLARVRAFKDWLTALVARERSRLLPR